MRTTDWLKACGTGLAVLILDLAVATIAVFTYRLAIEPGHPNDFYMQAAIPIATWTTRIAGPILQFLAMWWLGRRRPERNAFAFAGAAFAFYLFFDAAMVAFQGITSPAFLGTMALKLAGAMLGAWAAQRRKV